MKSIEFVGSEQLEFYLAWHGFRFASQLKRAKIQRDGGKLSREEIKRELNVKKALMGISEEYIPVDAPEQKDVDTKPWRKLLPQGGKIELEQLDLEKLNDYVLDSSSMFSVEQLESYVSLCDKLSAALKS